MTPHCSRCGRWIGGNVCQCRIEQVRRELDRNRQIDLALFLAQERERRREQAVAEVACCVYD